MRNNPERPYLPHHQPPQSVTRQPPISQKSITGRPFQTQPTLIKSHLPSIQNLQALRKEYAKPKIKFKYKVSTEKLTEDESVKTGHSSPKANPSPEKTMPQTIQNATVTPIIDVLFEKQSNVEKGELQFSNPIFRQHKLNSHQTQKRKEVKSKTLSNKYEVIAEVLPTLEVSRHQRDEEMDSLRRELNETRSLNNQLRTEVLRWERKFEQIQEAKRMKAEELTQQIKQLRIELQKAQNQRLLAQLSQAGLQKRIKKMVQESEQREKLQKVREDYRLKPYQADEEKPYLDSMSYQPYIQLYLHHPQ